MLGYGNIFAHITTKLAYCIVSLMMKTNIYLRSLPHKTGHEMLLIPHIFSAFYIFAKEIEFLLSPNRIDIYSHSFIFSFHVVCCIDSSVQISMIAEIQNIFSSLLTSWYDSFSFAACWSAHIKSFILYTNITVFFMSGLELMRITEAAEIILCHRILYQPFRLAKEAVELCLC